MPTDEATATENAREKLHKLSFGSVKSQNAATQASPKFEPKSSFHQTTQSHRKLSDHHASESKRANGASSPAHNGPISRNNPAFVPPPDQLVRKFLVHKQISAVLAYVLTINMHYANSRELTVHIIVRTRRSHHKISGVSRYGKGLRRDLARQQLLHF